MPGTLQTSQMLKSTERTAERVSEAVNDLLSPLTPQLTKHDNSRILTDPFSCLRIHYRNEIPMDPQMALATIIEFLDRIQHQWLNYNQGPKRFLN